MSTIKDYLEMSPMQQAIQNEKFWEQTISIQKVIHDHWEASGLMALQQSIQLAIQPTIDAMAPLSSVLAESMTGVTSFNKLHLGIQQVQDIHNVMQPMAEYQSLLHKISKSISMNPISNSIDLSEINLDFDVTDDYNVTADSLSEEESELVNEISRDNKLISYLKSKYHQFKELPSEKVALYFWNDYIRPILIGLIIANLAK
nr:MAG TPA: hypothetical protein [Caudoviricetes sp.]